MFLFGLLTLALAFVGLESDWFGAMPFQLVVGLAAVPWVLWALAGRRAPASAASAPAPGSAAHAGSPTGQTAYGPIRAADSASVLTPRPGASPEGAAAAVTPVPPAPPIVVPAPPPLPPRVTPPLQEALAVAAPAVASPSPVPAGPVVSPGVPPSPLTAAAPVTYEGIAQVVASTLVQLGLTPPLPSTPAVPQEASSAAPAPEADIADPAIGAEAAALVEPKRLLPAGWRGRPRARVTPAAAPAGAPPAPSVTGPIRLESDAPRPAPAPADLQYAESASAVAAAYAIPTAAAAVRPAAGSGTLPPMADATPWPAAAAFHGSAAPAATAQDGSDRRAGRWQQVGEADIAVDSARERRIVWAQIAIAITLAIIVIIRARHWLTGDLAP